MKKETVLGSCSLEWSLLLCSVFKSFFSSLKKKKKWRKKRITIFRSLSKLRYFLFSPCLAFKGVCNLYSPFSLRTFVTLIWCTAPHVKRSQSCHVSSRDVRHRLYDRVSTSCQYIFCIMLPLYNHPHHWPFSESKSTGSSHE